MNHSSTVGPLISYEVRLASESKPGDFVSAMKKPKTAMTVLEKRVIDVLFGWPVVFLWPIWGLPVFLYACLHPKFYRKSWERS